MIGYYEGFDYGGEVADKESNFILWPTDGGRTGLVDADLLPYRVGFTLNEMKYIMAKRHVTDGDYPDIKSTPQFEDAFDQLCATLNKWLRESKCQSAMLFSTKSDANFRLSIAYTDPYKGQRGADKPPFFYELKEEMSTALHCVLANGIEADDWLSIEAWRRTRELGVPAGTYQHKEMCDCVVISTDKDSTITPSWHYNPDTRVMQWVTELGSLKPKFKKGMVKAYEYVGTGEFYTRGARKGEEKTKRVCVGEKPSSALTDLKGTGLKFFYAQIIMGDAADNYKGLQGSGMTAAYKLLDNCKTEKELYLACLKAYKERYGVGHHWCPNYQGTDEYYKLCMESTGKPPEDWEFWRGKGAYLTAYDRMLEQGRLAWMQTFEGDIWRKDKGRIIDPFDKEFWHDKY